MGMTPGGVPEAHRMPGGVPEEHDARRSAGGTQDAWRSAGGARRQERCRRHPEEHRRRSTTPGAVPEAPRGAPGARSAREDQE